MNRREAYALDDDFYSEYDKGVEMWRVFGNQSGFCYATFSDEYSAEGYAAKISMNKFIESMKNQGVGLPSSEQLRELLKYAPDDVLLQYLKRAEEELIPEGKLNAAKSIALELIKLDNVKENHEMYEIAMDVLEKSKQ